MLQHLYSHFIFFVTYKCSNKTECYITQEWKGLPVTNTIACWAHSYVKQNLSVVNMAPGSVFTTLHFFVTYKNGQISQSVALH